MKKTKLIMLLCAMLLLASLALQAPAYAAEDYNQFADDLNAIGLFKGTDKGYELDVKPTRVTGAVMLVRLLGKEEQALGGSYVHPFKDVPQWANAYIGYMYKEGLTKGVSSSLFGANDALDVNGYLTFVLRSLGYDDTKGDFSWANSAAKGKELALIDGSEQELIAKSGFKRGNMVRISRLALDAALKGDTKTLQDKLYAEGAISHKLNGSVQGGLRLRYDYDTGFYGYVNNDKQWTLKPRYARASEFSEGLAHVVFEDGAYTGYITADGSRAFDKQFAQGSGFRNGKALVGLYGVKAEDLKPALIDKQGRIIETYPSSYTMIDNEEGWPYLQQNEGGKLTFYLFDRNFNKYDQPISGIGALGGNLASVVLDQGAGLPHFGLYHTKTGKMVLSYTESGQTYPFVNVSYSEGMVKAKIAKGSREQVVYLNEALEPIANKSFMKGEDFSEGVALVGVKENEKALDKTIRYGYINKDGSWFIEPSFTHASSFQGGSATVKRLLSSFGILRRDGSYAVNPGRPNFVKDSLMTQEEYDFVQSEAKAVFQRIIKPGMSELQKVTAINTYIIGQTEYDYENYSKLVEQVPYASYSPYGVFKYGIAVCEGYTLATKILLDLAGIENVYMVGDVGDDASGWDAHAWNLVKVDGRYYHLDTTWNDDYNASKYFLVSDRHMGTIGKRVWDYGKYPTVEKGYFNDVSQPNAK